MDEMEITAVADEVATVAEEEVETQAVEETEEGGFLDWEGLKVFRENVVWGKGRDDRSVAVPDTFAGKPVRQCAFKDLTVEYVEATTGIYYLHIPSYIIEYIIPFRLGYNNNYIYVEGKPMSFYKKGDTSTTLNGFPIGQNFDSANITLATGDEKICWYENNNEINSQDASGSIAMGGWTLAAQLNAHAEGSYTKALGIGSHAEGVHTQAGLKKINTATGKQEPAGFFAHAEGGETQALGDRSHAEGDSTIAEGIGAHSEGVLTVASGRGSHAEGNGSQATNSYSHAEGEKTISSGPGSHAEGSNTQATAKDAHAEGRSTQATALDSHAEGLSTKASASQAHAEGNGTTASGQGSHAEGWGTIAKEAYQHVEGKWNAEEATALHITGCGTSNTNRANCFTAGVSEGIKYITVGNATINENDAKTLNGSNGMLPVGKGGTGKTSHTTNAVLIGNNTGAVKNVATQSGAFYATAANGAPKFGTLPIEQGGTGAINAQDAREKLGAAASSHTHTPAQCGIQMITKIIKVPADQKYGYTTSGTVTSTTSDSDLQETAYCVATISGQGTSKTGAANPSSDSTIYSRIQSTTIGVRHNSTVGTRLYIVCDTSTTSDRYFQLDVLYLPK